MTDSADVLFRRLQTAVGRLLVRDGEPSVKADGKLGVRTLSAINLYITPGVKNCNELAARADEIVQRLESMPSKLMDKPLPVPMVIKPKKAGFPWWLVAIGVAGVLVAWNRSRPKAERWF